MITGGRGEGGEGGIGGKGKQFIAKNGVTLSELGL